MITLDRLVDVLTKAFGGLEKSSDVEVTKSVDTEKRMAMFVVLEPQTGNETTDLHGDTYTEEEIEKACNNFNTHCNTANIFHQVETQEAEIVQSFITPASFVTDDGRTILKGSWLQWWHFPETEVGEALWEGVKTGDVTGVSISARATVENLE